MYRMYRNMYRPHKFQQKCQMFSVPLCCIKLDFIQNNSLYTRSRYAFMIIAQTLSAVCKQKSVFKNTQ